MLEHAPAPTAPNTVSAAQLTALIARTTMRLRSWLPEYANGKKAVLIAEQALPSQVGATLAGPARALCVGPGDWLIVSPEHSASTLRDLIGPDLSAQGLMLVDVTDGLASFDMRGPAVRDVLSKGCGLDLRPLSFPAGRCARTRFAQIPLLIDCIDESPRFELFVGRSYAHYLQDWLTDAAAEFADALR